MNLDAYNAIANSVESTASRFAGNALLHWHVVMLPCRAAGAVTLHVDPDVCAMVAHQLVQYTIMESLGTWRSLHEVKCVASR